MSTKPEPEEGNVPDNMEEKILREAGKLFMEKGLAGTSTTEIARSAGCNQALVHYYFRTKDNLFNRVFEEKAKAFLMEILSVETGEGTFAEKLSRMIGLHFEIIRENSPLVLFLVNEITHRPERLVQIKDALGDMPVTVFSNFRREFDREVALGNIRPVELMDIIISIISLNGFVFISKPILGEVWKLREEDMKRFLDRRRQQIIDTVLLSLRPVK